MCFITNRGTITLNMRASGEPPVQKWGHLRTQTLLSAALNYFHNPHSLVFITCTCLFSALQIVTQQFQTLLLCPSPGICGLCFYSKFCPFFQEACCCYPFELGLFSFFSIIHQFSFSFLHYRIYLLLLLLSRFSHIGLFVTLWTAAHQAPLPTGFSRQEYWSGLPFPSPLQNISDLQKCTDTTGFHVLTILV